MRLDAFLAHDMLTRHKYSVGLHHVADAAKFLVRKVIFVDNLAAHDYGRLARLFFGQSRNHILGLHLAHHGLEFLHKVAESLHHALISASELAAGGVINHAVKRVELN